jgi:hypothetical protein
MNKPNKSLIAMRKAGLVMSTACTLEQKAIAEQYKRLATRHRCMATVQEIVESIPMYTSSRRSVAEVVSRATLHAMKAEWQAQESYLLGLRGIRIGQEDLFCNN